MQATYKIGEAAARLNLKTYVLRFWETEFPQIVPLRTEKGQRLYTEENIALLRRIRHLLHERGLTIEGARKALAEEAARGMSYTDDALAEAGEESLADEGEEHTEEAPLPLLSAAPERPSPPPMAPFSAQEPGHGPHEVPLSLLSAAAALHAPPPSAPSPHPAPSPVPACAPPEAATLPRAFLLSLAEELEAVKTLLTTPPSTRKTADDSGSFPLVL